MVSSFEKWKWKNWRKKMYSIALLFQKVSIIRHYRDVNVFIFLKNDRFVMKTTTKNRKRNDRFLKRSLFQKVRFKKMVVFIKIIVSLTIDNDDPSLMIVNEKRKPTSKGICNSHWVIFKKTSRSSPTTFKLHVRRHLIKLHFFQERSFLQKDRFYKVSLTIINIISKKISKTIVF